MTSNKTANGFSFPVTATWSLQTETAREKGMITHLTKQQACVQICPQRVWKRYSPLVGSPWLQGIQMTQAPAYKHALSY